MKSTYKAVANTDRLITITTPEWLAWAEAVNDDE